MNFQVLHGVECIGLLFFEVRKQKKVFLIDLVVSVEHGQGAGFN